MCKDLKVTPYHKMEEGDWMQGLISHILGRTHLGLTPLVHVD